MPTPADKKLYEKVKEEAKARFNRWPSAYGSAWLAKEYKKRGGTYKGESKEKKGGVSQWMREEWIQVLPYTKDKSIVPCGARKNTAKACRPLHRIAKDTPMTMEEVIELHGKKKVAELARKKIKDMNGRLYWKTGKFTPSIK